MLNLEDYDWQVGTMNIYPVDLEELTSTPKNDHVGFRKIFGWRYTNPSGKYDFVSWDEIPNIWKNKIHVPNHQTDI